MESGCISRTLNHGKTMLIASWSGINIFQRTCLCSERVWGWGVQYSQNHK